MEEIGSSSDFEDFVDNPCGELFENFYQPEKLKDRLNIPQVNLKHVLPFKKNNLNL